MDITKSGWMNKPREGRGIKGSGKRVVFRRAEGIRNKMARWSRSSIWCFVLGWLALQGGGGGGDS